MSRRTEQEIREELEAHLRESEARLQQQGMDAESARKEALRRFGDPDQWARKCADEAPEIRRKNRSVDVALALGFAIAGWFLADVATMVSKAGLVPLDLIVLLHLAVGVPLCIAGGIQAVRTRYRTSRVLYALSGTLAWWFALVFGTWAYFDVWQAMPDAPEEAFADGAALTGVIFAGWLPGVFLMGGTILVTWLVRWLRARGARAVTSS